jgi:hypothetical protein
MEFSLQCGGEFLKNRFPEKSFSIPKSNFQSNSGKISF